MRLPCVDNDRWIMRISLETDRSRWSLAGTPRHATPHWRKHVTMNGAVSRSVLDRQMRDVLSNFRRVAAAAVASISQGALIRSVRLSVDTFPLLCIVVSFQLLHPRLCLSLFCAAAHAGSIRLLLREIVNKFSVLHHKTAHTYRSNVECVRQNFTHKRLLCLNKCKQ